MKEEPIVGFCKRTSPGTSIPHSTIAANRYSGVAHCGQSISIASAALERRRSFRTQSNISECDQVGCSQPPFPALPRWRRSCSY
jgi:hypothetical protein